VEVPFPLGQPVKFTASELSLALRGYCLSNDRLMETHLGASPK